MEVGFGSPELGEFSARDRADARPGSELRVKGRAAGDAEPPARAGGMRPCPVFRRGTGRADVRAKTNAPARDDAGAAWTEIFAGLGEGWGSGRSFRTPFGDFGEAGPGHLARENGRRDLAAGKQDEFAFLQFLHPRNLGLLLLLVALPLFNGPADVAGVAPIEGGAHGFTHRGGLRAGDDHARPGRDLEQHPMRAAEIDGARQDEQLVKEGLQRVVGYGLAREMARVVWGESRALLWRNGFPAPPSERWIHLHSLRGLKPPASIRRPFGPCYFFSGEKSSSTMRTVCFIGRRIVLREPSGMVAVSVIFWVMLTSRVKLISGS